MKRDTNSGCQAGARAGLDAYLDELVATAPTLPPNRATRSAPPTRRVQPTSRPPAEDATLRQRRETCILGMQQCHEAPTPTSWPWAVRAPVVSRSDLPAPECLDYSG